MVFKNNFLVAGILLFLFITSLFTFWIKNKQDTFADEIISDASSSFKTSLNEYLSSVQISINQLHENVKGIDVNAYENKDMDTDFTNLISKNRYLKGIILTNNEFSYVIYKENSTWVVSYDENIADSQVNWQRLSSDYEVVSQWTDTYNFFPVESNFEEINNQLKNNDYLWRTAISQLQDSRDIFTCIFKTENSNKHQLIAGLVFSTREMSKYFISVLKFEHPLISILTSGDRIITPLISIDTAVVAGYNTLSLDIEKQVVAWKNNGSFMAHSYSFEKFNQIYWTRIDKIESSIGLKGFAVTMSSNDLAETERKQEMIYLYASALFLLALIISVLGIIIKRRRNKRYNQDNEMISFTHDEIFDMIKKGETEYVEFKSSLRWDYREEKINKILENVILKSLAAFANAKGGTLFIGVSDELEILGLENDFSTLKKKNVDYFELHARKLISNQYGIAFSNENLLIQFPEIEGKIICIIQVQATGIPIFLKTRNKQGAEVEKFYVRSGNASQEISSLKEINDYIQIRFDN